MKESCNCKQEGSSSSSSSCFSSCCSSSLLMLVVVPLILVSAGFICAISGPNTWDSLCHHPWLCSSSSNNNSSSKREGNISLSSSPFDPLPSSITTKIDSNTTRSRIGNKEIDHVQEEEEAENLSDAFKNSSSTSPLPELVETTTIQIQVPQHDAKTKEEGSKTYMNTSEAVVGVVVPETTRVIQQRQHTKLHQLEAGLGPVTSSYIPYLFKNSIRALCNANTSEGFTPSKDVSFPEINLRTGDTNGWIGGPSPSHRPILAFFAGGLHGPIRPVLLEHWENKDNDIRVYKYLPKEISYHNMMQNSKYCICPSGYEVASPRIVEAIYTGCVPVLISDNYVPPFSDVLNWKTFSVEIPVSKIPNLKTILMGISSRQYIRMQRRGVQVRKHFEVNSPPKRFDVFHMILHSIWLRRLNVQINDQ